MELVGKNAFRRRFKEFLRDSDPALAAKPKSASDLAISIQGNDLGTVYWPVIRDEKQSYLLASAPDLKSEGHLKLTRKNPKHLAWFDCEMFTSSVAQETDDICIEDELRDIINSAYVQSPMVRREIELMAAERGKRLKVARQLETYQKEWRRRLSLSDKECCY